MKKYLSISILFVMIILPCWALGATFYVTQDGSGDGSSYANSMSVSSHNSGRFTPGDVIYLCDTITSQVKPPCDGSSKKRITYRGDCVGHPGVLDFNGNPQFLFSGIDYLYIQDIEFKNGSIGLGTRGSSDYVTIKRCTIHHSKTKGISITYSTRYRGDDPLTRNTNITIGGASEDGNNVYNVGTDTGGQDITLLEVDGFTISYNKLYATTTSLGIDGIATHRSCNGTIKYNEIHDHNKQWSAEFPDRGEDGIDIKNESHHIDICYNHIYNHTYQTAVTVQLGSHDINIYGNCFHNNENNILIFARPYNGGGDVYNVNIWSNIIYEGEFSGINLIRHDGHLIDNVNIFNNTFAENANDLTSSPGCSFSSVASAIRVSHVHSNLIIKNNIFYKNRPGKTEYIQLYVSAGYKNKVTFTNNVAYWPGHTSRVFWGNSGRVDFTIVGSNNTDGDPGFTDPANHDYTLASGSTCIDRGVGLGTSYDLGIAPNTVWTSPPVVTTSSRDELGWSQGAYIYRGDVRPLRSPANCRVPVGG